MPAFDSFSQILQHLREHPQQLNWHQFTQHKVKSARVTVLTLLMIIQLVGELFGPFMATLVASGG